MVTGGFKRLLTKWSTFSFTTEDPISACVHGSKASQKAEPTVPMSTDSPLLILSKVAKKGFQLLGFIILRFLTMCFFAMYHLLNGTYFNVRRSRRPENYSWSARVFNVVGQHKYDYLVNMNSLSDFILVHSGFDHPHRVLADEVSLYEINDREAIFVEAPPGVEVWRHRYNAFHNIAQVQNAIRVIIMPIKSFYKLAGEIEDPKGRLVFITNTARCGSTLLTRVFEETGDCVTLSEPATVNALRKYVGREDDPRVQAHVRSVIRILCKPTYLKNFVIKITPTSTSIVPLLQKIYPNASQVFIYRDGLPVSKSMFKIWLELPMGFLNIMFARYFHWCYVKALNYANYYDRFDNDKAQLHLTPGYGQACFFWGNIISMYRKFRKSGHHIAAIKYEDLVEHKEFCVTRLFDYCAIPRDLAKPAVRAFESDSQANSLLSMTILKRCKLPEFTTEVQRDTDKICKFFKLAKLGESCVIEGTLTRELVPCPVK